MSDKEDNFKKWNIGDSKKSIHVIKEKDLGVENSEGL